MLKKLHNDWRFHLFFILFTAMLLSLFFSRAALSVSISVFVISSFFVTGIKKQLAEFLTTPLLWSMALLFVVPLFSGLWSEDKDTWRDLVVIKLPLLFLPLAFAAPMPIKVYNYFAAVFIAVVVAAAGWSTWQYATDAAAVEESYLRAKTIVTPLQNDHVRFSWLVSAAVLVCGWLFFQQQKGHRIKKIILVLFGSWLIIYLHILAARTGLLCFYLSLGGFVFSLAMQRKRIAYFLLALLLVLPLLAWIFFPTFQNRLRYFRYDMGYFSKIQYLPGGNDAMRMISLKAGWQVFEANPLAGVGFGDIKNETDLRYEAEHAAILETDKIYPSSEVLVYAAGAGLAGLLLLLYSFAVPFFTNVINKLPWRLLAIMAVVPLLFDVGLEVQFGVFIHAFTILWCWKLWQGQNLVTP